ncbi:MAG: PEP-CTERM sorting domain-containing protein, partial [Pirellula sp.]
VGFSTTNTTPFNISSIGWSKDNVNYTAFSPNDFVNNILSGGGVRMSSVIDLGTTIGGNAASLFYLRYTLPAGIEVGSVVQSIFYANSDGAVSNGILADQFGNNFVTVTRSHTAVPEPTSLLLVSSVALWLRWRAKNRCKRSA